MKCEHNLRGYCTKICSTESFWATAKSFLSVSPTLRSPDNILLTGVETTPGKQLLSAVILLNSPANRDWSFKEYLRLWGMYRDLNGIPYCSSPTCYFLCTDGVYESLVKFYCDNHVADFAYGNQVGKESPTNFDYKDFTEPPPFPPLCDAIIGDMDSFLRHPLCRVATEAQKDVRHFGKSDLGASVLWPPSEYLGTFYATVDEIPEHVLNTMHVRATPTPELSATRDDVTCSKGAWVPFFLPVSCQITTDFKKALLLLSRLRKMHPQDFTEWHTGVLGEQNDVPLRQKQGGAEDWKQGRGDTAENDDGVKAVDGDNGVANVSGNVESEPSNFQAVFSPPVSSDPSTACQTFIKRVRRTAQELIDYYRLPIQHDLSLKRMSKDAKGEESDVVSEEAKRIWLENLRCAALLEESCDSSLFHTHVFPNVAVLGSYGGRFDHEIGAISILLSFSDKFHIMLVDPLNIIFACVPNGLTQWLRAIPENLELSDEAASMLLSGRELCHSSEEIKRGCGGEDKGEMCGIIPFGVVKEMETTGFLYNIVKGRNKGPFRRYDGVTQTEKYRFEFGGLISTSNETAAPLMLVDLRVLESAIGTATNLSLYDNPPTAISMSYK